MAYNDQSYGLFQGQLFGARRLMNGALLGGYLPLGDADNFTIDPKQKFNDITESQSGLGLTSAHIPTETAVGVKMNLLNINSDNLALALWGTSHGAVSGSTVTDEAVVMYPGAYVPLAHPGVSSVALSAGVLGTDYAVDAANGGLQVLPTTTLFTDPAGTAVTVDYTFAAYTGRVDAFTAQQPVLSLRLNAINTANSGQPVIVSAYQWAPDMTDMLSLIEKKHVNLKLNGMLLQDTTKPVPSLADPFSQFFHIVKA